MNIFFFEYKSATINVILRKYLFMQIDLRINKRMKNVKQKKYTIDDIFMNTITIFFPFFTHGTLIYSFNDFITLLHV